MMLNGVIDKVLGHRNRFPSFLNRAIDYVADHPSGVLGRIAARRIGTADPRKNANVTTAADRPVRVLIAPVNYAGQGRLWARSLERADTRISARNMAIDVPGGFSFPADLVVPVPTYHNSPEWQRRQYRAVQRLTHVLLEAEEPLFGRLFDRDVAREVAALQEFHLDIAFMCHGTDIRLPSRHRERTPWSPYRDERLYTVRLERLARSHRELLDRFGLPTFVSTPDLLWDVPAAKWCPVVVDSERWSTPDPGTPGTGPLRVVHAPTSSLVKGTQLIEPVLRSLHSRHIIDYHPIVGVPSTAMSQVYQRADVVLDQFRLGSYGAAACEAMAAGRLVIGHVLEGVREIVRDTTGTILPVVEATPDSLESVLIDIADDRSRLSGAREAGIKFVADVHDGRLSARVLRTHWLDADPKTQKGGV